MNAITDFRTVETDQQWFEQFLERLLAPLSADLPCGPPARHDPLVTEIRLLREEDDPNLPMGQWERPLKRADWTLIEQHCVTLLCEHSKDLQTAVWLLESWMRQHGFGGLSQGLRLIDALLRSYWAELHPPIEDDGDCDARLAPLEWLNETLSTGVQVHAALLTVSGCRPPQISLATWERMAMQDMEAVAPAAATDTPSQWPIMRDNDTPLTRPDLLAAAGQLASQLEVTQAAVRDSLEHLHAITEFLRQHLRDEAPRLGKLKTVLEGAQRVLLQLQSAQATSAAPATLFMVGAETAGGPCPETGCQDDALTPFSGPTIAAAAVLTGGWRDRNEAYATLEALADYLIRLEPHSPTPFLLRRAVRWGNMPLPEVLAEILREEGDLNRLVNVLGLQS